ncbi:VOC family protein [Natrarchaeobius oligotrophus]|uniref:Lactoylglutathione lyase n=1 Tax=Natrarchaeobius chitinivorans TaxID=1679083 RepID=A0A3N6N160_NATCH|nr:VOC family protein [Natrarchaeobius chitinivorans]RQH02592.1 lactoylglutathione lyase [Natrarchaeobius chitinivorans]
MTRRRTPIAKLGHVAVQTPDLDESLWFFSDVMGLQVTERDGHVAYLRGMRDWEHHSLILIESGERGVDHMAFRTTSAQALADLEETLVEEEGESVSRVDAGEETGLGEAIRVEKFGHSYEFYWDVEKPDAPEGQRSGLKNRVYSESIANRIAPRRIDHVHVNDPGDNADAHDEWLRETLGFQLNERYRTEEGEYWGWWYAVTALPHDIAIHREPADAPTQFHHVAFHLDSLQDLWTAGDICSEHGLEINNRSDGPAMHAITRADCMYVKDPASGVRLELFAGPGYLNFEPDWEPIEWTEGEIGGATSHQWHGGGPTWDGIDYV